jgi:predicted nucleic acid-binding protein
MKASSHGSRSSSVKSCERSIASVPAIAWIATRSTIVRFVDTNILLYAISSEADEQDKARRAKEVLTAGDVALSAQVLQEFYVQATRESRSDALTHAQAFRLVESFMRFPVAQLTTGLMLAAMATRDRFGISYWDAAILEAARSMGCGVVLSEDLSDRQDYAGVRVENPFV